MPFTLEDLPAQPPSVDDAATLSALTSNDIARFAMTYDGYAHYGDRATETLTARREEWERGGTLPRDIGALRGLLFLAFRSERFVELDDTVQIADAGGIVVREPDHERITDARREQERFKHALLARIRALIAECDAA